MLYRLPIQTMVSYSANTKCYMKFLLYETCFAVYFWHSAVLKFASQPLYFQQDLIFEHATQFLNFWNNASFEPSLHAGLLICTFFFLLSLLIVDSAFWHNAFCIFSSQECYFFYMFQQAVVFFKTSLTKYIVSREHRSFTNGHWQYNIFRSLGR